MSRLRALLGDDASLDGDAQRLLKALGKKAVETKTKALHELHKAISTNDAEWSALLLPQFSIAFARLADDPSWQVREHACKVLGLLAQQLKKRLLPHLKQLLLPWLRCRFDGQHDVRSAAIGAFSAAFPGEGNYSRALSLFVEDLVRGLDELLRAPLPSKTGDESADAEAGEAHTRKVCTALQAAAHLLTEARADATQLEKVCSLLGEHLLTPALWKLATSQSGPVRCALYSFIHVLLQAAPELASASKIPLAATLLDGLKEQDPAGHAALWSPLLLFLQTHPTAVQQTKGAGAHILPRLASLLRHGCHGAAPTVASLSCPWHRCSRRSSLSQHRHPPPPAAPPSHPRPFYLPPCTMG